jgi:hypothetical protein
MQEINTQLRYPEMWISGHGRNSVFRLQNSDSELKGANVPFHSSAEVAFDSTKYKKKKSKLPWFN